MKIKTSNLTDIAFEWAVAKAEGTDKKSLADFARLRGYYAYTTDWAQGGPIIEREEICLKRQLPCSVGYEWNAWIWTKHRAKGGSSAGGSGATPLVAAMRCYVASKLGDEVEIPEELL